MRTASFVRAWRSTLFCLLLAGLWTGAAFGVGNVSVVPAVRSSITYDDNLFSEEEEGFVWRLTPSLSLETQWERSGLDLQARTDIYRYPDFQERNRENHDYALETWYELSDRVLLDFMGRYRIDYTYEEQLLETGEITSFQKRSRTSLNPGLRFALSPRSTAGLTLRFQDVDFVQGQMSDTADYQSLGTSLSLSHVWSPRTVVQLQALARRTETEDQTFGTGFLAVRRQDLVQESIQTLAGWDYEWSETVSLSFQPGLIWSRTSYRTQSHFGPEEFDEAHFGWLLNSAIKWEQEHFTLNTSLSRSVVPDVEGQNITRDSLSLDFRSALSERLSFFSRGSISRSESVADEDVDNSRFFFKAGFRWRLSEYSSIILDYDLTYLIEDGGDTLRRNRSSSQYVYRFPVHF